MKDEDENKGIRWRLPTLTSTDWGKMGPAFGYGIGCGVGVGAGLVGGAGIGLGFPGMQFGLGFGAGCGVGVGFGYGMGRGRASDQKGRYSNVGKLPPQKNSRGETIGEFGAIINDFTSGLQGVLDAVGREIEKRRK